MRSCLAAQAAQLPGQAPRREHDAPGSSSEGHEHAAGGTGDNTSSKQGGQAPSMHRHVPHVPLGSPFAPGVISEIDITEQVAPGFSCWHAACEPVHVSLCRSGRFDLPADLAKMALPALVVPVPPDIPTEGGTSRCASECTCGPFESIIHDLVSRSGSCQCLPAAFAHAGPAQGFDAGSGGHCLPA